MIVFHIQLSYITYLSSVLAVINEDSFTYIEPVASVLNLEIWTATFLTLTLYMLTTYENSQTQAEAQQCSRPPAFVR